jgi:16S rRNA (cytosine967-C5)-methyltransferase
LARNSSLKSKQQRPGARDAALQVLHSVFFGERPLFEALERHISRAGLEPRDTAFARAIVMTVLRRLGEVDAIIATFLREPLPVRSGPAELILRMAAAELLFLDVPPHAAVSSAVDLATKDPRARHFKGLINAVARRMGAEGRHLATALDAEQLSMPPWAWQMLVDQHGEATTRAIARAHLTEPPLDIFLAREEAGWEERLGATRLPTGTLRRPTGGRIEDLPGFMDGSWWVQDAAASMPARLLGDVRNLEVIDLCAAPGGKTMQLAAAGARVTAIDLDPARMDRVRENAVRLRFDIRCEVADARTWSPIAPADAVLLDAPCSATGTVRRHPEILWRKDRSDLLAQAGLQHDLLRSAARMVRPGGRLVYCVCSLAREEGEEVVDAFLSETREFSREPVDPAEVGGEVTFLTGAGDLRTLPSHWADRGGLDGFFACRLRRNG